MGISRIIERSYAKNSVFAR